MAFPLLDRAQEDGFLDQLYADAAREGQLHDELLNPPLRLERLIGAPHGRDVDRDRLVHEPREVLISSPDAGCPQRIVGHADVVDDTEKAAHHVVLHLPGFYEEKPFRCQLDCQLVLGDCGGGGLEGFHVRISFLM